jgi:hypothetical protein
MNAMLLPIGGKKLGSDEHAIFYLTDDIKNGYVSLIFICHL